MKQVALTGVRDGVNRIYTLAETPVSGGLTLPFYNGILQKLVFGSSTFDAGYGGTDYGDNDYGEDEIVGPQGVGVFSQSGVTITLGFAPPPTGGITFSGTVLNDLSTGGSYSGNTTKRYLVEITAIGTPDTFQWSDDGGATYTTGVAITGAAQTLSNGITITFTATTGHTLGSVWQFQTESLYALIQTTLAKGLKKITFQGDMNGVNPLFIVSETPAANSTLLGFLNGVLQEEVTFDNPGIGLFNRTTTQVLAGLPPNDGEDWEWFVESTQSFGMQRISTTGQVAGTLTVSLGASPAITASRNRIPLYFAFLNGVKQTQVPQGEVPEIGQVQVTSNNARLRFGLALEAEDDLQVFLVGFTTEAATSRVLLTLDAMIGRLQVLMNGQIDAEEARLCLDEQYRQLIQGWAWSFMKNQGFITVIPVKNTGTITLNQDSVIVIGDADTVVEEQDIGAYLRLGGVLYEIVDIDIAGKRWIVSAPFSGASAVGSDLELLYLRYELAPEIVRILSFVGEDWDLEEESFTYIDAIDEQRETSGEANYYVYAPNSPSGIVKIEFWPVQLTRHTYRYIGLTRDTLDDAGKLISDISNVLLKLGAELACPIIANKRASEGKIDQAQFWLTQGPFWGERGRQALAEFKRYDFRRFGRRQAGNSHIGREYEKRDYGPAYDHYRW